MLAYLGPAGTYSGQAAAEYIKTQRLKIPAQPLPTISAVMDGVNDGAYRYGLVPIENMLEGSVGATLDMLAHKEIKLFIIAEIDLAIQHKLMVLPGVKNKDIRRILSHPQALAQCQKFLHKYFPAAEILPVGSTAEAGWLLKKEKLTQAAAIGSPESAREYGLRILAEDIADHKGNLTRFAVLAKELRYPEAKAITSFVFSCRKDKPGGLYEILGFLAKDKINMTKIASRPSKAVIGDYIFFIDIDGTPANKNVRQALAEIEQHSDFYKLLGVYRRR